MTKKTQFDIQFLLPELPDEHDACAARLVDLMIEKKGIEKAHIREGNGSPAGEFCVHFDPAKISLTEVRSMAKAAGAALDHHYGHMLLKTKGMTARRARTMRREIAAIAGVIDVGVSVDGFIRIEFDKTDSDEQTVLDSVSSLGISTEFLPNARKKLADVSDTRKPDESDAEYSHGHGTMFGENTELIFAILCGVFLVAGWVLSISTELTD